MRIDGWMSCWRNGRVEEVEVWRKEEHWERLRCVFSKYALRGEISKQGGDVGSAIRFSFQYMFMVKSSADLASRKQRPWSQQTSGRFSPSCRHSGPFSDPGRR